MTHLDLSYSHLSGLIPYEISRLSKLAYLSFTQYKDYEITIGTATFRALAQNLSNLRELDLSGIDLSFLPSVYLLNLSSTLTSLYLGMCKLRGELPENIFWLPKLQVLYLANNEELYGHFPKSNWSSPLEMLDLSYTRFSIDLSHLVKHAKSLSSLFLSHCHFVGSYPAFFSNLSQIALLDLILSNNNFSGPIPWSCLNLNGLELLDLSFNNFVGQLPEVYGNSTGNFSSSGLAYLRLDDNLLDGIIPSWVYALPNLWGLELSGNQFTGEIGNVELEQLSKSKKLSTLNLSYNKLTLHFNNSIDHKFNNLRVLGLSSCNISEFPNFFRSSMFLTVLDLSKNQIKGSVPKWLWERGKDSMIALNLSYNFLTYIEPLPWKNLEVLDLRFNLFSGPLPTLSPLVSYFFVSRNQFSGEIPISICNLMSLQFLDLSYNNLSGEIPHCMGNFSETLSVLDLRRNKLNGTIVATFAKGNSLRNLDLNGNRLEGPLPRSLEHCRNLEVLDIGNNLFEDTFPGWLESLPELKILVLRSNRFRGSIAAPKTRYPFQKLRIMDLSANVFRGALPIEFLKNFKAMMNVESAKMEYMGEYYYQDSIILTIKGSSVELLKIQTILTTIDFSSNNFTGKVPELIGRLKSLKGLNLSHNKLKGAIPSSLGNLTNLEWLDLSSNELVGKIPIELASITSLEFLNLSHNHLEGPIPHGNQFNTFGNDSFSENLGLCGFPLSINCKGDSDVEPSPPAPEQRDDPHNTNWFDWKIVSMGYASGLVIGISIGYMLLYSDGKLSWVCAKIARELHRRTRM